MTRVLQIHTRYREPGGEDAFVAAERRALAERGHEVYSVERQNSSRPVGAVAQLAGYAFDPGSDRSIIRLAERLRPDVIHVHNTWFGTSPGVLPKLRRAGFPTVVTVHNYRLMCPNALLYRDGGVCEECVGRAPWPGVMHGCYRGSRLQSAVAASSLQVHRSLGTWSRGVDRILALTHFVEEKLVAAGIAADRVAVHGSFVDDPGERPVRPSESTKVVCVGRLSAEKGFDVLLRAWSQADVPGLDLVVVGDGPEAARLKGLAAPGVIFLGRIPRGQVAELLLGARAVVAPSQCYEGGQPLSVLESMASGAAVVGSDLGGLGETIRGLGDRWVVPSTRVDRWVEALRALTSPSLVDRGGAAARRLYLERFSPAVAMDRLEGIYGSVRATPRAAAIPRPGRA